MRRWLPFFFALVILLAVHEGMHAGLAALHGEYRSFHVRLIGLEVEYRTPTEQRSGVQWALISGAGNLVTVCMGYVLLMAGRRLARLRNLFLRASCLYLTLLSLLADPLNLSIGPFIYGGDANGIGVGLGVSRYVIQAVSLAVLLVNRELVAQVLFPTYGVRVRHILFRPLLRRAERSHRAGL